MVHQKAYIFRSYGEAYKRLPITNDIVIIYLNPRTYTEGIRERYKEVYYDNRFLEDISGKEILHWVIESCPVEKIEIFFPDDLL